MSKRYVVEQFQNISGFLLWRVIDSASGAVRSVVGTKEKAEALAQRFENEQAMP